MMLPIESLRPDEGAPKVGSEEYGAWNLRRALPTELSQRPAVRWPAHAAALLDIPEPTLKKLREGGDHPRLYALGRALYTTIEDLRTWILGHEVAPAFRARPATRSKTR